MTAAEFEQNVVPMLRYKLRSWCDHPDWPDIWQEALLRAWASSQLGVTKCKGTTAAVHGGLWAAKEFLRSRQCSKPMKRPGTRYIDFLSLAPDGRVDVAEDGEDVDQGSNEVVAVADDFSPRIIDQVAAAQKARELYAHMSPRQRQMVRLRMEGWELEEIGKRMGCSDSTVCANIKYAIRQCRKAMNGNE